MSRSAPAVGRPRTASIPAWVGLALAFAIGTASGAVAITVISDQARDGGPAAIDLATTRAEVASLVAKADAAASRGDVRLAIQFRSALAASVGSVEIADELTRLAAKADAAARRGDVRLAIQFREEFAAYVGTVATDKGE